MSTICAFLSHVPIFHHLSIARLFRAYYRFRKCKLGTTVAVTSLTVHVSTLPKGVGTIQRKNRHPRKNQCTPSLNIADIADNLTDWRIGVPSFLELDRFVVFAERLTPCLKFVKDTAESPYICGFASALLFSSRSSSARNYHYDDGSTCDGDFSERHYKLFSH
jgi:hypothetical protein